MIQTISTNHKDLTLDERIEIQTRLNTGVSFKAIGKIISKDQTNTYLVKTAWLSVKYDLRKIEFFHTDRVLEFANDDIDKILKTFEIE